MFLQKMKFLEIILAMIINQAIIIIIEIKSHYFYLPEFTTFLPTYQKLQLLLEKNIRRTLG